MRWTLKRGCSPRSTVEVDCALEALLHLLHWVYNQLSLRNQMPSGGCLGGLGGSGQAVAVDRLVNQETRVRVQARIRIREKHRAFRNWLPQNDGLAGELLLLVSSIRVPWRGAYGSSSDEIVCI